MTPEERLAGLERRAELGGGEDRLRRQAEGGKLTARERVDLLFDAGLVDWAAERMPVSAPVIHTATVNNTTRPTILRFDVFMAT